MIPTVKYEDDCVMCGLPCSSSGEAVYPDHNGYMPMASSTYDNVAEELADVEIMVEQMKYLLELDTKPIIEQKLDRQLKRIAETESDYGNPKKD